MSASIEMRRKRNVLTVRIVKANGGRYDLYGEVQYIASQALALIDAFSIALPESQIAMLRTMAAADERRTG